MSRIAPDNLFLQPATCEEYLDSARYLQTDAAYLYRKASQYRDNGQDFLAEVIQDNAAHSAELARMVLDLAEGRGVKIIRYFHYIEHDETGMVGWVPLWIPSSANFDPSESPRGLLHDCLEHALNDTGTVYQEAMAFGRLLALRTIPGNGETDAASLGAEFAGVIEDASSNLELDELLPRPPKMARLYDEDGRAEIRRLVRACAFSHQRNARHTENPLQLTSEFFTRLAQWLQLGFADAHRRYGGHSGCTEIGTVFDWAKSSQASDQLSAAGEHAGIGDCLRVTIDIDHAYGARFTPIFRNPVTGSHPWWLQRRVVRWHTS